MGQTPSHVFAYGKADGDGAKYKIKIAVLRKISLIDAPPHYKRFTGDMGANRKGIC